MSRKKAPKKSSGLNFFFCSRINVGSFQKEKPLGLSHSFFVHFAERCDMLSGRDDMLRQLARFTSRRVFRDVL